MKVSRDANGLEAARALKRLGFIEFRKSGSHRSLRKGGRTVLMTQQKPLKPGTLRGIGEQPRLSLEQFVKEL